MHAVAAQARYQQRVEELCGAVVRALAADPDLHFRGGLLHGRERPFPATAGHLRPSPESDDLGSFRGAADGLALRRRHSDAHLHARLAPDRPAAALIFELLEQFRVESLGTLPGVIANLRHRHEAWSEEFHGSGPAETQSGLLLFTLAQMARARVTAQPVVTATEGVIEATRFALAPLVGRDLAALRRSREDQTAYAGPARRVANEVADLLDAATGSGDPPSPQRALSTFSLLVDGAVQDGYPPVAGSGQGNAVDPTGGSYRVFTRSHDRELVAHELVRPELLGDLRRRLDERVTAQGVNVPGLARRLHALLAEPARVGWDDGREEGVVDGRRLARLVSSPTERRIFRIQPERPVTTALVTFLVDCSGSMSGTTSRSRC